MDALDEPESRRLAALTRYAILDTEPEASFDRITQLAAHIFAAPIALVTLVDHHRQWFKACVGLALRETDRSVAFCAHALASDEPLVVPDAHDDPRFRDNPLVTGAPFIRFYAGAPLVTLGGERLGTLCIIDRVPRTLDATGCELLRDLAATVVDLLELRARTAELAASRADSERHRHQLVAILDNMEDLVIAVDLTGRSVLYNQAVVTTLGDRNASLEAEQWAHQNMVYLPDQTTPFPRAQLPVIRALAGETVRDARVFVRTDASPAGRWHSVNASPIRDDAGAIRGAVTVGRDVTEAHELAAKLEQVALYDELTGVLNRRGFLRLATSALALARRKQRPALLLYFDLDGLKQINDRHGHAAGDALIRRIATILSKGLRDGDLVGRLGGDELVALCVETSAAEGELVLERLQQARLAANRDAAAAPLVWSIGVAAYDPAQPTTIEELIALADRAMYADKRRPRP